MDSIYKIRTNKRKNKSLDFCFFQDSLAPVQILKHGNLLFLPLFEGQKLIIEATNNRPEHVGISINNGFYNHIVGASPLPKQAYEDALFEIKPFSKGLIRERYSNAYTKDNPTDLIITKAHYQNKLTFYLKIGFVEFLTEDSDVCYTNFNSRSSVILNLKIIPPII